MDELIIIALSILAGFGVIVYWIIKKVSTPKKRTFPACRTCEKYMEKKPFSREELPIDMEIYLEKFDIPEKVIRRHICPDSHDYVWIAPPVEDMDRNLFVWKRT